MQDKYEEKLNPWVTIWTRPRETMRSIINTDPKGTIIWLAIISGILSTFVFLGNLWMKYPYRETLRYGIIIFLAIILGAISGIIGLYFSGWLFRVTGNWLGGKGTFTEVKAAAGWTNYPFIITGLINIAAFFLIRSPILYYLLYFINLVISVWGFIIAIKLLAEAHTFSSWRALGAIIISALLIIAIVMIITLFLPILSVF